MSRREYSSTPNPSETLIIARTEEGFRVHAPTFPTKVYMVTGASDQPSCTCLDFQSHEVNPEYRCGHILAVEARFGAEAEPDPIAAEERRAIQEENGERPGRRSRPPKQPNGSSHMLLKRSVSPDGRIDSLSVEFSTSVDKLTAAEIREQAATILGLQDSIASGFKRGASTGNGTGRPPAPTQDGNGLKPGRLLDVSGMPGKWGRRLFVNVEVNGEVLRLFGNRKQLAEAIETAGYADFGEIAEGLELNIPCKVKTKKSPDGHYTNIDQVFPAIPPERRSW